MGPPGGRAAAAADSHPMLPPKKTPLTGLIMLVALGCGAPEGGFAGGAGPAIGPSGPDGRHPAAPESGQQEDSPAAAMERTRAQFEAARHGARVHASSGCPLCADPLAGRVPPEALLNGPAEVWN